MKHTLNLKMLEAWCNDAVTLLGSTGVKQVIIDMQLATITRHSGKPALYAIAEDCAEGIGDQPAPVHDYMRKALLDKHGLDVNFFLDKKLKKIKAVIKRGKIKSETEYRDLSDFATDNTQSETLLNSVEELLAIYDKENRPAKK
jgi:hypothetical protein